MASAEMAQAYERKLFVDTEKSLFEDLKTNYGVKIYSPPDLDQWQEKIQNVYESNADKVGGMDHIKQIQGM
jgi:TRAP-type C4-dicarboxylate transport system substrate-binding protein